jgi:hypothetical protein
MSETGGSSSVADRTRKAKEVIGVQRGTVSSRHVYSSLINSRVLPIVRFGFEIDFDGFLLCQNINFFLGTSIETSVDAGGWSLSVCGSGTADTQSLNTQDLEM